MPSCRVQLSLLWWWGVVIWNDVCYFMADSDCCWARFDLQLIRDRCLRRIYCSRFWRTRMCFQCSFDGVVDLVEDDCVVHFFGMLRFIGVNIFRELFSICGWFLHCTNKSIMVGLVLMVGVRSVVT